MDYLKINKESWNSRVDTHYDSEFYDNKSFIAGKSSLNDIELEILPNLEGKSVLHLQCHFGQDSISLSRMGAKVTGVDLSNDSISKANELAAITNSDAKFICCDVYDLPNHLDGEFDIIFSSYGAICWLPDLNKWAEIVSRFLKKNGKFIFVEFHPVVGMVDENLNDLEASYFNAGPIHANREGTYTEGGSTDSKQFVTWNHSIGEVVNSMIENGLEINSLKEYDYSPYNCFQRTFEDEPNKFRIKHKGNNAPMVYSVLATKINI
ncbi:class I SAM-dependent methyltransferase [uncultured Lutibacter sp.]|uniref:class I SAM-dependent methyltransferase n=1 Tax=uncultured Lutibacter sp. TaxID=437739 RepID=UPI0026079FF1|nr:class I SAM-dependent methyltransferase [uncultured Lutibacter sp.]